MSMYNRFEDFMIEVVNEAENKCQRRYNLSLNDLYKVKESTIMAVIREIIYKGDWNIFLVIIAFILLNPITFGIGLTAFMASPAGNIISTIAIDGGGLAAIKILYQNKQLPLAIKKTGENYKKEYKEHINQVAYINSLLDKASDFLIDNAKSES